MADPNQNQKPKVPFTDEQKDFLMDYMFNKFMQDKMMEDERRKDIYSQPRASVLQASAKSDNPFMNMLDKSVKSMPKEGILTVSDDQRIKELQELLEATTDPSDRLIIIQELNDLGGIDSSKNIFGKMLSSNQENDQALELLIEQFMEEGLEFEDAVRKAKERVLESKAPSNGILKAKDGIFVDRDQTFVDKVGKFLADMFDGKPSYVPSDDKKDLIDNMIEGEGFSDQQLEIYYDKKYNKKDPLYQDDNYQRVLDIFMRRAGEPSDYEMMMKDGGIVSLNKGGDPKEPLKKTIKKPSIYSDRPFEDFLFDAGFIKDDEGTMRGSKSVFNKHLLSKGIKPGTTAATTELNTFLKERGKPLYISLEMSQGGKGLNLAEEATGTTKGRVGSSDRGMVFDEVDKIRKRVNKMKFDNKKQKYDFLVNEIKKVYPGITAGTLASLFKGTALGAGLEMFMPSELQAAELPMDMRIKQVFQ